jgi:hypothetical protein
MIYVHLLTVSEKDEVAGQLYDPDSYFNPIQDANDDWIISVEEVDQCVNPELIWVKNTPLIEYIPKETN